MLSSELLPWVLSICVAFWLLICILPRQAYGPMDSLNQFFLARRSLGPWSVALTFVASWFGATSIKGSLEAYLTEGLSGLWLLAFPSFLSTLFIAVFLAKKVALRQELSQPEAMEKAYGSWARQLMAVVILVAITTFVGSQLVAAGQLFAGLLGWPVELATAVILAAVLVYSVLGGYLAVVLTDMAQMGLIVMALLLLFTNTAWLATKQGLPNLMSQWQQLPPSFWQLAQNDWPTQLALTLSFAMGWSIAPEMWQRMSSLKNPQLASKAAWRGVAMLSFLLLMVFGIGLVGVTLHLGTGADKNGLLMLAQLMPHPALAALVVLGFLAAVSSTMDSSINVGSLVMTSDLYQRLVAPKASNRHLLWASRIATVLVALPAYVIAIRFQNLIQVLWLSVDVYACALFWPIIGLLYDADAPQGGRRGRWAIAVGASVSVLTALLQYGVLPPIAWYPAGPWATLTGLTLSGCAYLLGRQQDAKTKP